MHRSKFLKFIKFLEFPVTTVRAILGHPGSCWVLLNFITLPDVSSSGCRHQVRRTSVALMFGLATAKHLNGLKLRALETHSQVKI